MENDFRNIFVVCEKLNIREISSWQRVGNFNQVVVKTLALDINQRSKTNLQFILSGELGQELLEHFHISWQNMTSWHDIFSVKHDQFDILISSLKIRHRWQIARQDDRFLNISYREKLNHIHQPNNLSQNPNQNPLKANLNRTMQAPYLSAP